MNSDFVSPRSIEGARCLITGGAGFLGQNLSRALLERGCEVHVLDRVPSPIDDARVKNFTADLLDERAMRESLKGVTIVFHTAAMIELSELAPRALKERVRAVNIDATARLLELSEEAGVERFIHTSSAAVALEATCAGGDESLPYSSLPDLYTMTKVAAEKLVRAKNGETMRTVSLRPGGIYGPGERGQLLAPAIRMMRGGDPLTVLGDGLSRLDYTFIDNLVDAHLRAAERLVAESPVNGAAYFVMDGQPMNHGEFMRRQLEAAGTVPRIRHIPAKIAWSLAEISEQAHLRFGKKPLLTRAQCRTCLFDFHFKIDAAKRDLGYAPISTHEGIERTVDYIGELLLR